MANPTAGTAVTWEVTTQTETTVGSPTGPLTKGFNVYFKTNTGLNGSVFVPESSFSPQTVSQLINAKVAQMESVRTLTGSVGS